MKKLLLIALAALSFGSASAYEDQDTHVWTWAGVEAPQEKSGQSFTGYIRNVQTGEFLVSESFTTTVDNADDFADCAASKFTITYGSSWYLGVGTYGGFTIKNSKGTFLTWGGTVVIPLVNITLSDFPLSVNEKKQKSVAGFNAYVHFNYESGSAEKGYKMYYGGLTDSWFLFLDDDLKTLKKSGSAMEESPYIYWQLISEEEMKEYHKYLKRNELNLYKGTFGSYIENNHTYNKIYVHRQLKAGYNTIALPFDVADVEAAFGEGAYVSKFTGAEEVDGASYTLTFTKQKNIEANVPYILHLNAATPEVTTFKNTKAVSEVSESATFAGWTFQSNYLPNQPMKDKYGVVNSTAKIMRGEGEKAIINGLTAYFTFNGTALNSVQAIFVDGQGELTDIQQLEPVGTENGQTIYTISGQRVNNAINGINIINGRKVLKK